MTEPSSLPQKTTEQDSAEKAATSRSIGYDLKWLWSALWASSMRWRIVGVFAAIFLILFFNVFMQIHLNRWNGLFFDALSTKNQPEFLYQLGQFFVIVAVLLTLVVAQTLCQELLKIELRRFLTAHLADSWLKRARPYQLAFAGAIGANPDQRVQEDTRKLAEFTAELVTALLQQLFVLTTFIGVLWTLSSTLTIPFRGEEIVIPGYMVWCAVIYAGLGSLLTFLVGQPLIRMNADRSQKEAELRFALVRLNESAESIGFLRGEGDERRNLDHSINAVMDILRSIAFKLARLTWVTSGYGWLSMIVPVMVTSPSYFAGAVTFGGMMRLVDAFAQVQSALRWFVDNFAKIADWRAALYRVMRFDEELRRAEAEEVGRAGIRLVPEAGQTLSLKSVRVTLPDGTPIIAKAEMTLMAGDRAHISGAPGTGRSTLFRVIAGLWPWGSGSVVLPPASDMMFLPPRPYLPLGSLREAACFPATPDVFSQKAIEAAMVRCGLQELAPQLDRVARWDREMTIGDQQRLTFVRLLLHRPAFVFMDEATSALDEKSQAGLLGIFDKELASSAVVMVSHRAGFEAASARQLLLEAGVDGSVLREIRRGPVTPEPSSPTGSAS